MAVTRNEPVLVCPSCMEPMDDHPTEDCWYVDKSECPYFARWQNLPGHDPAAVCAFGCVDEPECVTCGPWDHYIEVAPSAMGDARAEQGSRHEGRRARRRPGDGSPGQRLRRPNHDQ